MVTTTAKTRIGTPIVPRNKADPTQSARQVGRMYRDIDDRYYRIKLALKQLFDERLHAEKSLWQPVQGKLWA